MKKFLALRHTRVFDKYNPRWDNQNLRRNPLYVSYVQSELNLLLRIRGYVSLNEALELLGFERTIRGGQAGWLRDPDPGEGDGRIDFGVWEEGFHRGKEWLHGELDAIRLYFNVDPVTVSMPRRIKKLKEEGRL